MPLNVENSVIKEIKKGDRRVFGLGLATENGKEGRNHNLNF